MKKQSFVPILTAVLLSAAGLSHATLVGMPSTAGTEFATWDTFPSASFTGNTPSQSATGLFTATLDNTFTGGGGGELAGAGDRIYSGKFGPGAPSSFNLVVDGTANSLINTLSLQLKFTSPGSGTAASFFSVSLTGTGSGSQLFLGAVTEGANTFNIYQWTWTGLNIPTSSTFEITATSPADHVSLDTVRVTDTAAVPEPSTYALMGLGLCLVVWHVRRRALRA